MNSKMTLRPGQKVYCKYALVGRSTICIDGHIVRRVKNGWRVRDRAGKESNYPDGAVYASQEAQEASVKNLRVAVDARKAPATLTEFPA